MLGHFTTGQIQFIQTQNSDVDFLTCFSRIDNLVKQRKSISDSVVGFNLLLIYDGAIKRLELDLFYRLVAYWTYDLLWL